MRDFGSECITREVVRAGVLGATSTGTTAVDMGDCRNGQIIISLAVGTDVASSMTIQHSYDGSTWSTLQAVPDASLTSSGFLTYNVSNMYRYVRAAWTRALSNGDSYWSIIIIGERQVRV